MFTDLYERLIDCLAIDAEDALAVLLPDEHNLI
jgi:hypothetical protein